MDESTIDLVREMLILVLKLAAPLLGAGIVVGLVISVLQSVTSIQDQSLTFVPKISAMIGVAILLLPWLAGRLAEYAAEMLRLL